MADIRKLLNQIAQEEVKLYDTEFIAPCVGGGTVRAVVAQLAYSFQPQPRDFEGWGIFRPVSDRAAEVIDEPSLPQQMEYLGLLPPLRLHLLYPLQGQTWLAYPVNESDMQQRFGEAKPLPVHLVSEGGQLEGIMARVGGGGCWFEGRDRASDPQMTVQLREELRRETVPEAVRFPHMTPELRAAYDLAWQQTEAGWQRWQQRRRVRKRSPRRRLDARSDERQLQEALRQGGGELRDFQDRGEFWQVEWTTASGERHTSAIDKNDLTVMSSGICLSGRDRDFDLQSLVGVIEQRDEW